MDCFITRAEETEGETGKNPVKQSKEEKSHHQFARPCSYDRLGVVLPKGPGKFQLGSRELTAEQTEYSLNDVRYLECSGFQAACHHSSRRPGDDAACWRPASPDSGQDGDTGFTADREKLRNVNRSTTNRRLSKRQQTEKLLGSRMSEAGRQPQGRWTAGLD